MHRFLINLLYFAVPLLLFSVGGDFLISLNLRRSAVFAAGEYPVWNAIYNGDIRSDIVIYGSSRAHVQINPDILEDRLRCASYNLGVDGHNFWMQYFRHAQYLRHNPPPRLIICSLDMSTLADRGNLYNPEQLIPYMLFDSQIQEFTAPYRYFHWTETYIPMLRYAGRRRAINHAAARMILTDTASGRIKGFKGQETGWTGNDPVPGEQLAVELNKECVDLFIQFLVECRQQNINLVLIYSPEFIAGQGRIRNRQEIMATYERLALQHGIPFIDYSSDSISLDQRHFYNINHLNRSGADKFTEKLASDLASLTVLSSPQDP